MVLLTLYPGSLIPTRGFLAGDLIAVGIVGAGRESRVRKKLVNVQMTNGKPQIIRTTPFFKPPDG